MFTMPKTACLFLLALWCLSGCSGIKGFYSGYKQLDATQSAKVVLLDNEAIIPGDETKVYAVTATTLTRSIADMDSVIVYRWSAHCSSESCIPVYSAEKYCRQNNYQLFVLADYYDELLFAQMGKTSKPLLAINHKYYGTDRANAYGNRFEQELDQQKILNKSNNYFRFMVFKKGKLVAMKEQLK